MRCHSKRWFEMPIDKAKSHESCALLDGHEGVHRSIAGFVWREVPKLPEARVVRR